LAIRSNSRSAAIAVNPAATGTIAGDANVTYSISAVDAATEYAWTVPDGAVITAGQSTLSITVEFDCSAVPGNVAVTPSNAEGSGPPSSLAVAVAAVEAAGSITGPTLACATETNVSFSIAAVGGATTYWWTVPGDAEITGGQGTAAITVHWGSTSGEGTVTPGNANDCPGPGTNLAVEVGFPPQLTSHPTNLTVCSGEPASFSVTATGAGLTYQWHRDGSNLTGATNDTLIVIADSDASFDCVASGACAPPAIADAATLTVFPRPIGGTATVSVNVTPPVLGVAPVSTNICAGGAASFSVVATGNGPLAYAWRKRDSGLAFTTNGVHVFVRLTGADTYAATLTHLGDSQTVTLTGTLANTGVVDRVRLFNTNGPPDAVYFNNLRVGCADDNAAAAAYAGGWTNGSNGGQSPLTGENAATLTVSETGSYDVCVRDACGSVTISSAATLTVSPLPALDIVSPSNLSTTVVPVVTVAGTAMDLGSGVAGVEVNGVAATTTNLFANWSATVTNLTLGTNTLTAIATAFCAPPNTTTTIVQVIFVDGVPPQLDVAAPLDLSITTVDTVVVSGTATDCRTRGRFSTSARSAPLPARTPMGMG
jgi:hypothetical protein